MPGTMQWFETRTFAIRTGNEMGRKGGFPGGGMGNMICIHNIVAVCAVLGMIGKEGLILRRTIWPFLLYCLVAGTVCFVLIGRVL